MINSMIKKTAMSLINHLVAIYNCALRLQNFSVIWKESTVLKKRKILNFLKTDIKLVFLGAWGKFTRRYCRLMKHDFVNNEVPNEQFGIKPGCSTTHQLLRLMEYIISRFKRKWTTVAVFLGHQQNLWFCAAYGIDTQSNLNKGS